MDRFAKKIGRLVERKPWWIIGVTLLVVCVAAMGMGRLSINNDTRVFFSEQNPQLKALEALENTYDKTKTFFLPSHLKTETCSPQGPFRRWRP